jgi:hypothetical protein
MLIFQLAMLVIGPLRVDRLRPTTDTIVVLATKPRGEERLLTTLVRRVERTGDVWRLTQRYDSPDGEWEVDTIDVSAQTLALVRSVELGSTQSRYLHVDGARVTGTYASDDATPVPIDLATGPFFFAPATEAFLAAYPIEAGSPFTFPEMNTINLHVSPVTLSADSTATIVTADGWVDCLVAHGRGRATLWIARGDGRLVRERWIERDGTVVWKLPRRDIRFRHEGYL